MLPIRPELLHRQNRRYHVLMFQPIG